MKHYGGNFRLTGKMVRVILGADRLFVTSNCLKVDLLEEKRLRKDALSEANGFVQMASKIHIENLQRILCLKTQELQNHAYQQILFIQKHQKKPDI